MFCYDSLFRAMYAVFVLSWVKQSVVQLACIDPDSGQACMHEQLPCGASHDSCQPLDISSNVVNGVKMQHAEFLQDDTPSHGCCFDCKSGDLFKISIDVKCQQLT